MNRLISYGGQKLPNESLPFWITKRDVLSGAPQSPYKIIWSDSLDRVVAVRTDAYPLIWMLWWFAVRVDETARALNMCFIVLRFIWLTNGSDHNALLMGRPVRKYPKSTTSNTVLGGEQNNG